MIFEGIFTIAGTNEKTYYLMFVVLVNLSTPDKLKNTSFKMIYI